MKKILTKKGFTLIELIVVIAILAILAAILIPSLTNYLDEAKQAKNSANARSYFSALALSEATGGSAPAYPVNSDGSAGSCSGTVALGSVSCTIDGKAYTQANNFQLP